MSHFVDSEGTAIGNIEYYHFKICNVNHHIQTHRELQNIQYNSFTSAFANVCMFWTWHWTYVDYIRISPSCVRLSSFSKKQFNDRWYDYNILLTKHNRFFKHYFNQNVILGQEALNKWSDSLIYIISDKIMFPTKCLIPFWCQMIIIVLFPVKLNYNSFVTYEMEFPDYHCFWIDCQDG